MFTYVQANQKRASSGYTVNSIQFIVPYQSYLYVEKGTYCVQAGLMAGEGEGETERQSSAFHPHVVQEVGDAVHDVVEELEETFSSLHTGKQRLVWEQ